VCLKCGKVVEFEDDVIETRQEDIAKKHKITLTNHSLYLYGECEDEEACDSYRTSHG
jgi:Fur family ferric uptake transcriptional regulator